MAKDVGMTGLFVEGLETVECIFCGVKRAAREGIRPGYDSVYGGGGGGGVRAAMCLKTYAAVLSPVCLCLLSACVHANACPLIRSVPRPAVATDSLSHMLRGRLSVSLLFLNPRHNNVMVPLWHPSIHILLLLSSFSPVHAVRSKYSLCFHDI